MPERPHFGLPFRFDMMRGGRQAIAVTEQDEPLEIADCVELAVRTEQGQRRTMPAFGRPPALVFLTDREMQRAAISQTIAENEPRAADVVHRHPIDWEDPGMQRLTADWYLP